MKKTLLLLLSTTMLYACSEITVDEVEDIKEVETVVVEKKPEKVINITPEQLAEGYNKTLSPDFEVYYNEKERTFMLTPMNPFFKLDLKDMMEGKQPLDDWEKFVDSFRVLSIEGSEALGGGYMFAVTNPFNTENVILIMKEGDVLLDAFEGME